MENPLKGLGWGDRTGGCSHCCAPLAFELLFDDGAPPRNVLEEGWEEE